MRRRRPEAEPGTELDDPARWTQCDRWDGGTQPCSCWLSDHVRAEGLQIDVSAAFDQHPCRRPFRYDEI